jgi:hypothetical protein
MGIVARAWIACGMRYVDTVDDFLVRYKWCGLRGGCLCLVEWAVCVCQG